MAVIYTQKQRKDTNKWVTVSYSDEAEYPTYHEYGDQYDTEKQAYDAWVASEEHSRIFLTRKHAQADRSASALADVVRRIMSGQQVEPVEMADALKQYDEQKA